MAVQRPAYFISGHGDQPNKTFIVPDGCYIVVTEDVCARANGYKFPFVFKKLLALDMDKIRNPKDNTRDIIRALGSVAIYGPGEECPDFDYQLLNAHFYKEGEYTYRKPTIIVDVNIGSGIINIEEAKKLKKFNQQPLEHDTVESDTLLPHNNNKNDKTVAIDYISKLYQLSAFPKMKEIQQYLEMRWDTKSDGTVYNMLADLNKSKIIDISQSKLCGGGIGNNGVFGQYGINGRIIGEGVYYHNVCRALPRRNRSYETAWNTWKSGNVNVQTVLREPRIYNSHFKELFKRRIPLLQNYYQSRQFQNQQVQLNINNCGRLEQNIINKRNMANKTKKRINTMTFDLTDPNEIQQTREEVKHIIDIDAQKAINIIARTLQNKRETCARRATMHNRNSTRRGSRKQTQYRARSNRSRSPHR